MLTLIKRDFMDAKCTFINEYSRFHRHYIINENGDLEHALHHTSLHESGNFYGDINFRYAFVDKAGNIKTSLVLDHWKTGIGYALECVLFLGPECDWGLILHLITQIGWKNDSGRGNIEFGLKSEGFTSLPETINIQWPRPAHPWVKYILESKFHAKYVLIKNCEGSVDYEGHTIIRKNFEPSKFPLNIEFKVNHRDPSRGSEPKLSQHWEFIGKGVLAKSKNIEEIHDEKFQCETYYLFLDRPFLMQYDDAGGDTNCSLKLNFPEGELEWNVESHAHVYSPRLNKISRMSVDIIPSRQEHFKPLELITHLYVTKFTKMRGQNIAHVSEEYAKYDEFWGNSDRYYFYQLLNDVGSYTKAINIKKDIPWRTRNQNEWFR